MRPSFAHRQHTRLWVLWLFVLAVLVPTASQGLMAAQAAGAPWQIVCSAPDASDTAPAEGPAVHAASHCALCVGQVHGPWLAPLAGWPAGEAGDPSPLPLASAGVVFADPPLLSDAPARAPPRRA